MLKTSVIVLSTMFILNVGYVNAEELAFPKTESEIIEALSIKDGRTVYEGVKYISEKGKIYKIIGGKRYRMRGLRIIGDSDIVPKAGALINFDFDSDQIQTESYPLLDEYGKALKSGLADVSFIIAGHTDNVGAIEYNNGLSERRANAVSEYLRIHHGIDSSRLTIEGFGETRPIASNESEKGRSLNRRVEFIRIE